MFSSFLNFLSDTGTERNGVRISDRHDFRTTLLRRSHVMNYNCLLIATCVSTWAMPIAFEPNNFSGGGNVTLLPFIVAGLSLIALGSCLSNLIDIALVSISRGSSPTSCDDNMLSPTLLIRVQAFWARTFVCWKIPTPIILRGCGRSDWSIANGYFIICQFSPHRSLLTDLPEFFLKVL